MNECDLCSPAPVDAAHKCAAHSGANRMRSVQCCLKLRLSEVLLF